MVIVVGHCRIINRRTEKPCDKKARNRLSRLLNGMTVKPSTCSREKYGHKTGPGYQISDLISPCLFIRISTMALL